MKDEQLFKYTANSGEIHVKKNGLCYGFDLTVSSRWFFIFIALCFVGLLFTYMYTSSSWSAPKAAMVKMKVVATQMTYGSEFSATKEAAITTSSEQNADVSSKIYTGLPKTDTRTSQMDTKTSKIVTSTSKTVSSTSKADTSTPKTTRSSSKTDNNIPKTDTGIKSPLMQDDKTSIKIAESMKPHTTTSTHDITCGSAITIDRKRYVCSGYGPRLGNLMFLHASNYGVAYDNNLTLALSSHDFIHQTFLVPKPVIPRATACRSPIRFFSEYKPRYFKKFDIPKQGNIRLSGYLQSWKYFRNSFEDIRKQFTFTPEWAKPASDKIQELVRQMYPNVDAKSVTTVGIHIRRGDYLAEKRPVADLNYIESAKKYFLQKYSNVLFIVATNPDDEAKRWCTENIINGTGTSVFSGFNHRFVDMAILTKCDHVIISTGTYSWWSGFLNKGTVIHYDWIPPNHYKFNREDYILDSWIGINSTIKYKTNQT